MQQTIIACNAFLLSRIVLKRDFFLKEKYIYSRSLLCIMFYRISIKYSVYHQSRLNKQARNPEKASNWITPELHQEGPIVPCNSSFVRKIKNIFLFNIHKEGNKLKIFSPLYYFIFFPFLLLFLSLFPSPSFFWSPPLKFFPERSSSTMDCLSEHR